MSVDERAMLTAAFRLYGPLTLEEYSISHGHTVGALHHHGSDGLRIQLPLAGSVDERSTGNSQTPFSQSQKGFAAKAIARQA